MPSGKNAWSLFVTFDLLEKMHALLAATMINILLVSKSQVSSLGGTVSMEYFSEQSELTH